LRERERVDSKKVAAQKQAIERRRLEIAKKGEQKGSIMGAKLRSANNNVGFEVIFIRVIADIVQGTPRGTGKNAATSASPPR
jgi:hypothetical protein